MERAWMEMALNNARLALQARWQARARSSGRLAALQEALDVPEPPRRIECFDISHTMGEGTVASCVVCVDGAMKKGEYRRFNIDRHPARGRLCGDAPGADAPLREGGDGRVEAPDLILIDGGKGQHGVAREVFAELGLDHWPASGWPRARSASPAWKPSSSMGAGSRYNWPWTIRLSPDTGNSRRGAPFRHRRPSCPARQGARALDAGRCRRHRTGAAPQIAGAVWRPRWRQGGDHRGPLPRRGHFAPAG
jgi:excinuclease ABC subunit C